MRNQAEHCRIARVSLCSFFPASGMRKTVVRLFKWRRSSASAHLGVGRRPRPLNKAHTGCVCAKAAQAGEPTELGDGVLAIALARRGVHGRPGLGIHTLPNHCARRPGITRSRAGDLSPGTPLLTVRQREHSHCHGSPAKQAGRAVIGRVVVVACGFPRAVTTTPPICRYRACWPGQHNSSIPHPVAHICMIATTHDSANQ